MTRPRTVLYVHGTSEIGGADVCLLRMAGGLDPGRYRPVALLPERGQLAPRLEAAGVRVVTHPMVQLRSTRDPGYQARYVVRFSRTVRELSGVVAREGADLVHSNSLYCLYGAWAARRAGVPHVWHVRELPGNPRPVAFGLTRAAPRLSRRVLAVSDAVRALFDGDPRVQTFYDGVDLGAYGEGGAVVRAELGIPAGAPLVGWIGRLDPWKGADVFVRAAAEVAAGDPGAHFLLCGGALPGYPDHAREVRRLAGDLGLAGRLHFGDWEYGPERIPAVLDAVDVLVHTSVEPEPFGLVLVEAMAASRPVVAVGSGGVPEIVVDGSTGDLVGPGDWEGTAAAIGRLLADPERARRMGAAGRLRAEEQFDVSRSLARLQATYDAVLQS